MQDELLRRHVAGYKQATARLARRHQSFPKGLKSGLASFEAEKMRRQLIQEVLTDV